MDPLKNERIDYKIYLHETFPKEIEDEVEEYNKICNSNIKEMKKSYDGNQFLCIDVLIDSCLKIERSIASKIALLPSEDARASFKMPVIQDFILALTTKKAKKVAKFIKKAISDRPELLFRADGNKFTEKSSFLKQSRYIWECHCAEGLMRPEIYGVKGRKEFTKELSRKIVEVFPNDELKRPLRILSIGPGGCFHELIQHAVLTNTYGYEIEWTLVDDLSFEETKFNFRYFSDLIRAGTQSTILEMRGEEFLSEIIDEKRDSIPDVISIVDIGVPSLEKLRVQIEMLKRISPKLVFGVLNKDASGKVQMQIL